MKRVLLVILSIVSLVTLQSVTNKVNYSSTPPTGFTGATGNYCTSCHSSFPLNSAGGSVSVTGLPTSSFVAGQQYNFSLKISHAAANRTRWGFAIKAVNNVGQDVGSFSSTNANAAVQGNQLAHNNAVSTAPSSSFTYSNLKWTAPTTPGLNDNNVSFYFVGNAANGSFSSDGDYIYSNSSSTVLPAILNNFNAIIKDRIVKLSWDVTEEMNIAYYEIEKSSDAQMFLSLNKLYPTISKLYIYEDKNPSYVNKPVYYRIKIVEKDGSFKYSKVVSATINAKDIYVKNTYPTIVSKGSVVTTEVYSNSNQKLEIQLVDMSGKVIKQFFRELAFGDNKISIPLNSNVNGNIMYLRYLANKFTQTIPIWIHQ